MGRYQASLKMHAKRPFSPEKIETFEGGRIKGYGGNYFCFSYWEKGATIEYKLIDDQHLLVTLNGRASTMTKAPPALPLPAGVDPRLVGGWYDDSLLFFSKKEDTSTVSGPPVNTEAAIIIEAKSIRKIVLTSDPVSKCKAIVAIADPILTATEIKTGKGGSEQGYFHGYKCKATWPNNRTFTYALIDDNHLSVTLGGKTAKLERMAISSIP